MLRFAAPVHIQIGHGESDKGGSISNQHKAYDLTFVGGEAGRDRLQRSLRGFDAAARTVGIGRPQLDHDYPGAPDWADGTGLRVWYAPTWEGDRPSIAYGSLASHGVAIIDALLAAEDVRIIYRPHPRIGRASGEHARADKIIRNRLAQAGDRHLVDEGEYGWQWAFADACITDISAVAYDWLATGKPLVITEPENRAAYRPPSPLLEKLPLLHADEVGSVVDRVRAAPDPQLAELMRYYFGQVADGASSQRFAAAIDAAMAAAAQR
jgi:CDP-Glycerol:Poly(glycerophosphate) glycerophosphotransferase